MIALVFLVEPVAFAQGHFKRFPATVTNNGAYVLAWGIQDEKNEDVASKTEVPPEGPALGDVESEAVEDYLVETATDKIVATIPNFTYYEGSEGRENHFDLEIGWSPDNHGAVAIYQSRYETGPIAWINLAEHKVSDVHDQIIEAILRVAIQKLGKRASDYQVSVSDPVFVRPRQVVLGVMVGELSSKKENPAVYDLDAVFNVKGDLAAPRFEVAMTKWNSKNSDSESKTPDDNEEAQLNRVYRKLAASLPPNEREALKQEQLKWLTTREHINAAEIGEQEFVQLNFTRRRISELEKRSRYR